MNDSKVLCPTCRFNELTKFILAGRWTEAMRCAHHVATYPKETSCGYYQREPGSDDAGP